MIITIINECSCVESEDNTFASHQTYSAQPHSDQSIANRGVITTLSHWAIESVLSHYYSLNHSHCSLLNEWLTSLDSVLIPITDGQCHWASLFHHEANRVSCLWSMLANGHHCFFIFTLITLCTKQCPVFTRLTWTQF